MKDLETYDVVVIGGGPAGAIASGILAKSGHNVLVVEKEKFPRYKVGESLIPHFWRYTDAIGASEAIRSAGFIKKAGGYVLWDKILRKVSFKDFGFTDAALHVERAEFDHILINASQKLGAIFKEGCKVLQVIKEGDKSKTIYKESRSSRVITVQSRYVIDASGQNAFIAKQEGEVSFDHDIRFQAYWGYFDKSYYLNSRGKAQSFSQRYVDPPMTLVCNIDKWGWAWQIVLKDKVSVGILVPREQLKAFKEKGATMEERFINAALEIPLTSKLLKGSKLDSKVHTIKDYAFKADRYVVDNCLLTGDASAFFDPINSEGITMAMYGGNLAAWAVDNMLRRPEREGFYKEMYIRQLKQKHNLFHLLAFPDELIQEEHYEKIISSVKNQSDVENHLALAQLMITQRGKDFPRILREAGIDPKAYYHEMKLEDLNLDDVKEELKGVI